MTYSSWRILDYTLPNNFHTVLSEKRLSLEGYAISKCSLEQQLCLPQSFGSILRQVIKRLQKITTKHRYGNTVREAVLPHRSSEHRSALNE